MVTYTIVDYYGNKQFTNNRTSLRLQASLTRNLAGRIKGIIQNSLNTTNSRQFSFHHLAWLSNPTEHMRWSKNTFLPALQIWKISQAFSSIVGRQVWAGGPWRSYSILLGTWNDALKFWDPIVELRRSKMLSLPFFLKWLCETLKVRGLFEHYFFPSLRKMTLNSPKNVLSWKIFTKTIKGTLSGLDQRFDKS